MAKTEKQGRKKQGAGRRYRVPPARTLLFENDEAQFLPEWSFGFWPTIALYSGKEGKGMAEGKKEKETKNEVPLRQPPDKKRPPMDCPGGKRPNAPRTARGSLQNIQVYREPPYGFES